MREKAGLTQEELAKKLNTTKQTVHKYEKNIVTNIPSDKIEALASVLDTTPEYILGWKKATKEDKKNSDTKAGITSRIYNDNDFFYVVEMLDKLDEKQFAKAKALLNLSFKETLDETK